MRRISTLKILALCGLACMGMHPASAATVPYKGVGTEAAAHAFRATSTGNLTAYFAGSTAAYTETLGLYVNGSLRDTGVFNDKTTDTGSAHDFGNVKAGDVLTFFINVLTTGEIFSSDRSLNSDGVNHVYATAFTGSAAIPKTGTFVAFEDLRGGGDLNYNDETFVFTNTTVSPLPTTLSAVPLPRSAPMFGAALLVLGGFGFGRWSKNAARSERQPEPRT